MQLTNRSEVPQSILDIYHQVGGNKAMSMAFSGWSYSSTDVSATFTIAPALRRQVRDGVTHVRVTLDAAFDTYRVEFLAVTRAWPAGREVFCLAGAYAADLRRAIEMRTGLLLSLGTMGVRAAVAS